jgi:hypothetical protein
LQFFYIFVANPLLVRSAGSVVETVFENSILLFKIAIPLVTQCPSFQDLELGEQAKWAITRGRA